MKFMTLLLLLLSTAFSAQANTYYWDFPFVAKSIQLPALSLDPKEITVSGLSSGAFMAVQLGVAYSAVFQGVGVVAGGIYGCSEGQEKTAKELCMKDPDKITVDKYIDYTLNNFKNNLVDDPRNIKKQKVFILAGIEDKTILPAASQKLEEFYRKLGNRPTTEYSLKMGHGFPSEKGKISCEDTKFPWINKCGYDGAKNILETFYGHLNSPADKLSSEILAFDQTEFGTKDSIMLDYGYVYIPKSCRQKSGHCRLHVALHGCMQGPSVAKTDFAELAGYNDWAETNQIVVLYPSAKMGIGNPSGCWDWFGYSGPDYDTKTAKQMIAIVKMIDRLLSN